MLNAYIVFIFNDLDAYPVILILILCLARYKLHTMAMNNCLAHTMHYISADRTNVKL